MKKTPEEIADENWLHNENVSNIRGLPDENHENILRFATNTDYTLVCTKWNRIGARLKWEERLHETFGYRYEETKKLADPEDVFKRISKGMKLSIRDTDYFPITAYIGEHINVMDHPAVFGPFRRKYQPEFLESHSKKCHAELQYELQQAVLLGNYQHVKFLVDINPKLVTDKIYIMAVRSGNLQCVQLLRPLVSDDARTGAAIEAAAAGNQECIEYLTQQGESPLSEALFDWFYQQTLESGELPEEKAKELPKIKPWFKAKLLFGFLVNAMKGCCPQLLSDLLQKVEKIYDFPYPVKISLLYESVMSNHLGIYEAVRDFYGFNKDSSFEIDIKEYDGSILVECGVIFPHRSGLNVDVLDLENDLRTCAKYQHFDPNLRLAVGYHDFPTQFKPREVDIGYPEKDLLTGLKRILDNPSDSGLFFAEQDLEWRGKYLRSALEICIYRGDLSAIKTLIEQNEIDISQYRLQLLGMAVSIKQYHIAKYLMILRPHVNNLIRIWVINTIINVDAAPFLRFILNKPESGPFMSEEDMLKAINAGSLNCVKCLMDFGVPLPSEDQYEAEEFEPYTTYMRGFLIRARKTAEEEPSPYLITELN